MLAVVLTLSGSMTVNAQSTDLTGRVYGNKNILKEQLDGLTKDIDKAVEEARQKAYQKSEEKLGRKLTAEEKAKLEKELEEAIKQTEAVKKGTSIGITVEFKDAKQGVIKMDMKIDDEAMKAAGIGWLKRKALKAALAIAPSSEKFTYEVKGKQIITTDSDGKDTLTISDDGKYLYGKTDDNKQFKLTRTQ